MSALVAALATAALAVALWPPPSGRPAPPSHPAAGPGWALRGRPVWCALAGLAPVLLLTAPVGAAVAPLLMGVVWWVAGRASEVGPVDRTDGSELSSFVLLVAAALRSGAAPERAIALAAAALPGPTARRMATYLDRLAVGVAPEVVWESLASDPSLAPLGRVLRRSHRTGAAVSDAVTRLSTELSERVRAEAVDRARQVGVKAALPLGLCLLPAFVLIGVVPMAAGLLGTILP